MVINHILTHLVGAEIPDLILAMVHTNKLATAIPFLIKESVMLIALAVSHVLAIVYSTDDFRVKRPPFYSVSTEMANVASLELESYYIFIITELDFFVFLFRLLQLFWGILGFQPHLRFLLFLNAIAL